MWYRKASMEDLARVWAWSIAEHPGNPRWVEWRQEYIAYNQTGAAATFVVVG